LTNAPPYQRAFLLRYYRKADLCPITGRSRLSYERSAYLFKHSSLKVSKTGWTLHQLRHSA